MEPSYPQLVVLAYQELPTETQVEPFAAIALVDQSLPPEIVSALDENPNLESQPQVAA
jgi:hypothetical protein